MGSNQAPGHGKLGLRGSGMQGGVTIGIALPNIGPAPYQQLDQLCISMMGSRQQGPDTALIDGIYVAALCNKHLRRLQIAYFRCIVQWAGQGHAAECKATE